MVHTRTHTLRRAISYNLLDLKDGDRETGAFLSEGKNQFRNSRRSAETHGLRFLLHVGSSGFVLGHLRLQKSFLPSMS